MFKYSVLCLKNGISHDQYCNMSSSEQWLIDFIHQGFIKLLPLTEIRYLFPKTQALLNCDDFCLHMAAHYA